MRMLWLHIRNSPIRWALPILIPLDLAILFLRTHHWVGVWPETGAAAQVPAYLLGILGAGAAAWAATAPKRHGLTEQLHAGGRRSAVTDGFRLAATIVILLIPYLVGQAVGFVVTIRTAPPGIHLWLGYVALGGVVTMLAAAVGWTMARIFGPALAALVSSLAFLLLVGFLDRQGEFMVVSGRVSLTVDPTTLALRFAAVTALLLALLWVPVARRVPARYAFLAVVAGIAVLVALAATPTVVPREAAEERALCTPGPTKICVWPEHEKYLPQLREVSARIADLPDAFRLPPRVNEHGIDPGLSFGNRADERLENPNAAPYFYILEGSPWSYSDDIGKAITSTTFETKGSGRCDWFSVSKADTSRFRVLGAWLEAYLINASVPDFQTNAPAEMQDDWAKGRAMLRDMSQAEQFRWAEGEVRELRARYCTSGR